MTSLFSLLSPVQNFLAAGVSNILVAGSFRSVIQKCNVTRSLAVFGVGTSGLLFVRWRF